MHTQFFSSKRKHEHNSVLPHAVRNLAFAMCAIGGFLLGLSLFGCTWSSSLIASERSDDVISIYAARGFPAQTGTRPNMREVGVATVSNRFSRLSDGSKEEPQRAKVMRVKAVQDETNDKMQRSQAMRRHALLAASLVVGSSHLEFPEVASAADANPLSDLKSVVSLLEGRDALIELLAGVQGQVWQQRRTIRLLPSITGRIQNLALTLPSIMQLAVGAKGASATTLKDEDGQRIIADINIASTQVSQVSSDIQAGKTLQDVPAFWLDDVRRGIASCDEIVAAIGPEFIARSNQERCRLLLNKAESLEQMQEIMQESVCLSLPKPPFWDATKGK